MPARSTQRLPLAACPARQSAAAPRCQRSGPSGRSGERVNALVLAHLGVAESIARRYSAGARDWSDLKQVAYVGLVKAAQRFDSHRGEEFVSYAVPTISGELKRYLRDCGWFVRPPRQVQELRGSLSAEIPGLTQRLGRQPTPADLAAALGQDLKRVEEALGAQNGIRPFSLDALVGGEERDIAPFADTLGADDPALARAEVMATLTAACRQLSYRDRRIVYLRFFEEKTQQEIGRELGVTQMQISRLLNRILDSLRAQLAAPEQSGHEPEVTVGQMTPRARRRASAAPQPPSPPEDAA